MYNDIDEIWKPIIINDEETKYLVSNLGRIYSAKNNMILKPLPTNNGYLRVCIYLKNGKSVYKSIHRLVAIAFIPNDDQLPVVNHKDGDKHNNYVDNLEWLTYSENNIHAFETGLNTYRYGDNSHFAKYSKDQVIESCELMESGMFTIKEIELMTGIDGAMLYMIKNRLSWINISIFYDVENCKQTKSEYSEEQIENVFKLLSENKLSVYEIMDITNVKTSTIYNILIHRYDKFKYLYEFYDVDKYTSSDKKLPDIDIDVQNEVFGYIRNNKSTKDIINIIHSKYNINSDRIRHFINRYKHKNVQRLSKG